MKRQSFLYRSGILLCLVFFSVSSHGRDISTRAEFILKEACAEWTEASWFPKPAYMRPMNDKGWQERMLGMQKLVRLGEKSVPALLKALRDKEHFLPERILAAQTLSFLASSLPENTLRELLQREENATVKLYLIDALGMQGTKNVEDLFHSVQVKNRDAKKHLKYLNTRNGEKIDPEILQTLIDWDPQSINSAVVGKEAPDFVLKSISGETIRLRDYQGEKAVVLVFIYGDT